MTDAELELAILQKYLQQYKEGRIQDHNNKCLRELKMHDVIRELTGVEGEELDLVAQHWHGKLVSRSASERNEKPLRRCSNSERAGDHGWHARAYEDGTGFIPAQARIDELEAKLKQQQPAINIGKMNVTGTANIGVIQKSHKVKKDRPKN